MEGQYNCHAGIAKDSIKTKKQTNKQCCLAALRCKKAFLNNVEFDIDKKIIIFLVLFYCLSRL